MSQHSAVLASALFWVGLLALVAVRGTIRVARGLWASRRQGLGQAGAASTEFIIVVIPFFLMTFGLMQVALASMARLLVNYSAFCAARAAMVVIPSEIGDEKANMIGTGSNKKDDISGSQKMSLIRNAAAYPLIAASPSIDNYLSDMAQGYESYIRSSGLANMAMTDGINAVPKITALNSYGQVGTAVDNAANSILKGGLTQAKGLVMQEINQNAPSEDSGPSYSVQKALDGNAALGDGVGGAILRSLRKVIYAKLMTAVTIGGGTKTKFEWNDPLQAKVTYLYYCQIPLANRVFGKPFYDLAENVRESLFSGDLSAMSHIGMPGYYTVMTAQHTLTNQGSPGGNYTEKQSSGIGGLNFNGSASLGPASTSGSSTLGGSFGQDGLGGTLSGTLKSTLGGSSNTESGSTSLGSTGLGPLGGISTGTTSVGGASAGSGGQ